MVQLEQCIRRLRRCWTSARAAGSIFELLLSEILEVMIPLHSLHGRKSLRQHDHWHLAYNDAVKQGIFAERRLRYNLMAPLKRRILIKLLATRAWSEAATRQALVRQATGG